MSERFSQPKNIFLLASPIAFVELNLTGLHSSKSGKLPTKARKTSAKTENFVIVISATGKVA